METSLRLSPPLESFKADLKRFGINLEPYKSSLEQILPVETAYLITGIPIKEDGTVDEEVMKILESIETPKDHNYNLGLRYTIGAYSLDSSYVNKANNGSMPVNAGEALKLLIKEAKERDNRLKIYDDVKFKTAEIKCSPSLWNYGMNPR